MQLDDTSQNLFVILAIQNPNNHSVLTPEYNRKADIFTQ